MNNTSIKRISWIDWAKFLCITMVVMGHAWPPSIVSQYIYSFHIPSFFIISGFLYKRHSALQTLKRLAIPVLFFSFVNLFYFLAKSIMIYHLSFGESFSHMCIFKYRYDQGDTMFTGLWFIEVLFVGRLLLGDLWKSLNLKFYYLVASLFVLIMIMLSYFNYNSFWIYYISRIIPCFPFLVVGLYLKKQDRINAIISTNYIYMILPIFMLLVFINGECDIFSNTYGFSYILFFFNACAMSFVLFKLCSKLPHNTFVETLSRGTLVVLGVHSIVIDMIVDIFNMLSLDRFVFIASPILTCIISFYVTTFLIKKVPILVGA